MSIFNMLRKTEEINAADRRKLIASLATGAGHRPTTAPPRTTAAPPAPPAPVNLSSGHLPEWMATRPLPVEAQILLRVMGEDISGAAKILELLTPRDRAVFRFYLEQTQRTINDVDYSEGRN
jgi:hypothetical protein